jgi:hypothetical protein
MRGNIIRRILIVLIIFAPAFSYTGCKKQAKCGCGKDVLSTFSIVSAYIYYTDGATITAVVVGDPYASTYTFCNPSEMFPKLADAKSGDILQLSGHVYWNCTYVYQTSNSSYYQSMAKGYDIQVTDLSIDLYGKGNPASGTQLNPSTTQK